MKAGSMVNKAVLTGALAVLVAGFSGPVLADKTADKEKCYGVVKAGKNDCAAGKNSCAGHATEDGDKQAYIVVPKGLCEKLVGGALEAAK